ncbi:MAG TPA: hypothetical protein VFG47_03030 [Geminicoccaceae bacterium]|nr:hypothetical protein [Geminicoccaceae bacterium]
MTTNPTALAETLADLVDVLVPGDDLFPRGSLVGAQALLADRLRELYGEAALAELVEAIAACGGPLRPLDAAERAAVVARLERERPELFARVRTVAYLSYYEAPAVHAAIRAMGFTYHAAPLPEGYPVGRFEPETDAPRHGRGRYLRTEEVRRVDLSRLGFVGGGARHG